LIEKSRQIKINLQTRDFVELDNVEQILWKSIFLGKKTDKRIASKL